MLTVCHFDNNYLLRKYTRHLASGFGSVSIRGLRPNLQDCKNLLIYRPPLLQASYRYDPFGNLISSSGSQASANVYRFSSKEIHPNSGFYYYLYRWYEPNLQRWLNRDPIAEPTYSYTYWTSCSP
jgi:RHS repeat-associated protein